MRQFRTYGSVRGVSGNRHSYRDPLHGKFHQHLDARYLVTLLGGHFVPKEVSGASCPNVFFAEILHAVEFAEVRPELGKLPFYH